MLSETEHMFGQMWLMVAMDLKRPEPPLEAPERIAVPGRTVQGCPESLEQQESLPVHLDQCSYIEDDALPEESREGRLAQKLSKLFRRESCWLENTSLRFQDPQYGFAGLDLDRSTGC